ncbi:MAG: hypothetical protein O3A63_20650 [Proteobacteria bacterium]|nr:hypothetical protein [Pseudomonadota bacterium]
MPRSASPPEMNGEISHIAKNGVLHVSVTGQIVLADVVDHVIRHLDLWQSQTRILWDLRSYQQLAEVSSSLREISIGFRKVLKLRAGGLSALVVNDQNGLGLARRLINHMELNQVDVRFKEFTSVERAEDWLLGQL